jgi:hypothetical protein
MVYFCQTIIRWILPHPPITDGGNIWLESMDQQYIPDVFKNLKTSKYLFAFICCKEMQKIFLNLCVYCTSTYAFSGNKSENDLVYFKEKCINESGSSPSHPSYILPLADLKSESRKNVNNKCSWKRGFTVRNSYPRICTYWVKKICPESWDWPLPVHETLPTQRLVFH